MLGVVLGTWLVYTAWEKSLDRVEVVVAKQDIAARTVLSQNMFTTKKISALDKHPKMIGPELLAKIDGRTAMAPMFAELPVISTQLGIEEKDGKMVPTRNDNMRRYKIPLSQNVVAPKIAKGDLIDIEVSFKQESLMKKNLTLTILKLIEVADIEESGLDGTKGIICFIHPQDATFLSFAIQNGCLNISVAPQGSRMVDTFYVIPQTFLQRYNLNLLAM